MVCTRELKEKTFSFCVKQVHIKNLHKCTVKATNVTSLRLEMLQFNYSIPVFGSVV